VTRPRAADDFATIRARMEELRREREPAAKKGDRDAEGGRSLMKAGEVRPRLESERWAAGPSSRRYGSGR
jgi:hypothetical protein